MTVSVGTCVAMMDGSLLHAARFALALIGMWFIHLGCNVLNDYFDHVRGNDAVNRFHGPFSGGSRVIQEGLISPGAMLRAGLAFLVLGAVAGNVLVFVWRLWWLLPIGVAGILMAYFYGAAPLALGYRGFGELCVLLAYGLLGVPGAYYVQTCAFAAVALLPAMVVGLTVAGILLVNEFPDHEADSAVRKRTLVVLFGARRALSLVVLYVVLTLAAAVASIYWRHPRAVAFYAAVPALLGLVVILESVRNYSQPRRFVRASAAGILFHIVASLAIIVSSLSSSAK
jgi:1,4-dihydroxy-2-naphthoate octaprenyltransferase